jgi:XTP/dITP diphosphohydrolase
MASSKTILVATTNPGKVRELRGLLGEGVEWKSLADFPGVEEVKEDGTTFAENARKKALGYAEATGLWTLADDSGLVVDALGGAPGVNSARFSGARAKGADRKVVDRRNMEKLLSLLEGVPKEKRTARFTCSLCLASPEKVLIEAQGSLEGLITEEPAGTGGPSRIGATPCASSNPCSKGSWRVSAGPVDLRTKVGSGGNNNVADTSACGGCRIRRIEGSARSGR